MDTPPETELFPPLSKEREKEVREKRARVRQLYAEVFSSSPLYRAAAAIDPEYWDKCSIGLHNYSETET